MNFENLEKYDILKYAKKSYFSPNFKSVFGGNFWSQPYQFITNCTQIWYKSSLKTTFLQKSIFLHF